MAKKFVRGITGIKTINNQDLDTNNVNDLLSDGKHNYIHRKKSDGSEEYHNLTNNIKTIEAEDNGLLTVINYNNSTNKAKLTVNHDGWKSQVLYSTNNTIDVHNGENGTMEFTTVDVNPEKVLQHDNLLTSYGISKTTSANNTTLGVEYTAVEPNFDLNNLLNGFVRGEHFVNSPEDGDWFFVSSASLAGGNYVAQEAVRVLDNYNTRYKRAKLNGNWGQWREQVGDKSVIDTLLAQKQNTLTSNTSIGVDGTVLRQLYTQSQTYTHANGILKTHVKTVSNSASVTTAEEEFNFLAKMNKTQTSADFTLNEHDTAVFEYLIDTYGVDNKINVCGAAFTLNGSNLNFNTNGAQYNPHIITFSDIIPSSAINVASSNSRVELPQDTPTVEVEKEIVETEKEQETE